MSLKETTFVYSAVKAQGPIRHKPWPIQTIKDCQDSFQTIKWMHKVKKVACRQDSCITMVFPSPFVQFGLIWWGEKSVQKVLFIGDSCTKTKTSSKTDFFLNFKMNRIEKS